MTMKIILTWIKQYVGFDSPAEELTGRFTAPNLPVSAAPRPERGSVSRSSSAMDATHREFPGDGLNVRAAGRRPALHFGCGRALEATEWRQRVAHGVSRGSGVLFGTNPGGATEISHALGTGFPSPLRGFVHFVPMRHGSSRGLPSVAALRLLVVFSAIAFLILLPQARAAALKTQNVFLIISDGLRWQEVFNGAEADLMNEDNGGVKDTNALRAEFWRNTPEARREALLPFFWISIARHGQLFGNQNKGSVVTVTNGKKFSYPGYNEILTGAPDARIDSNDKKPNPNLTVFEWLDGRPGLRNRVAVFGTWDVFPYIFNIERSHLPIWPVWESKFGPYEIPPPQFVADLLRDTTPMWEDLTYDSFLFHAVMDHLKREQSRLVFVGFGETALVVVQGPGQVAVVDTATKAVTSVAVGQMPHWIAVSSDGGFAYVTNEGSNDVSVMSLDNKNVIATVPIGAGPRKIVIQPGLVAPPTTAG